MIMFDEIYNKAVNLFEDPKIKTAYMTNKMQFCKLMYPFLDTSYSLFTNPLSIGIELTKIKKPSGKMEIFDSDGITNTFTLSFIPEENSIFQYIEDGVIVNGEYKKDTNQVIFQNVLQIGKEYSCEAYFPGQFLSDFDVSYVKDLQENIANQVKDILARMLIKSWSEHSRNFLLDIQNILATSGFKLSGSNASNLKSKIEWVKSLDTEISKLQNKLSITLRFVNSAYWGNRNW